MAAADVELRRLAAPYRVRFAQALTAVDVTMTRLYVASAPADVEEWVAVALPVIQGLQSAVGSIASSYTARQLEVLSGRPVGVLPAASLVDDQVRWLRSPVLREWKLRDDGLDPALARVAAGEYAGELVSAQARRTERQVAADGYQAHWKTREPLMFKRLVEPGACGWCRVVADRLYSAADPGRWHAHCRCSWRMLTPEEAAAHRPQFSGGEWRDVIRERSQIEPGNRVARPTPQPQPDPAPGVPRAAGATEDRRPSELVELTSDAVTEIVQPIIRGLDRLHPAIDRLPVARVRLIRNIGGSKGGHFSPRPNRNLRRRKGETAAEFAARNAAHREKMEILLCDRGDDTIELSFLHEFGHRLDWDGRRYLVETVPDSSDLREAIAGFLAACVDSPTIVEARLRYPNQKFVRYYRSPVELWARAYSQWAAHELGGPPLSALRAMQRRHAGYQWPDEEFDRIRPHVERVLQARGLVDE